MANMTKLPPIETGYIIDASRPMIALKLDVEKAGCSSAHAHPRGQLIYASQGTMRAICKDQRVSRVMEGLIKKPDDNKTLDEWAQIACVSSRTLTRLFTSETGLSFSQWRKRLRLLEAMERLGNRACVTDVAFDLGYKNVSAFIEMFRQTVGAPPGQYFRGRQ